MNKIHEEEVNFAPKPNLATWYQTNQLPLDEENVATCFGFIKYQDHLVFVKHISRGEEMPGGHRESGESLMDCLKRELKEECGITELKNIKPVAIQEIKVSAPKPQNYNYTYPISYQVVFYAETTDLENFEPSLDSVGRVLIPIDNIKNHLFYKKYQYLVDAILPNIQQLD